MYILNISAGLMNGYTFSYFLIRKLCQNTTERAILAKSLYQEWLDRGFQVNNLSWSPLTAIKISNDPALNLVSPAAKILAWQKRNK